MTALIVAAGTAVAGGSAGAATTSGTPDTQAGLCHSDLHLIDGDLVPRFPIVGGHEGPASSRRSAPG